MFFVYEIKRTNGRDLEFKVFEGSREACLEYMEKHAGTTLEMRWYCF